MAHKLRSVNTRFWDDPFITELNPSEKLLFLYLLTNPMTNIIGIYEVTLKRICFDTGLTKETISKGLERFETLSKAFYSESFIILPNFLKNQKLNANMKVAAIKEFSALPEWLKDRILSNGSKGLGNGYQTILNGLAMIRQVEGEVEVEIENENEEIFENFDEAGEAGSTPKKQKNSLPPPHSAAPPLSLFKEILKEYPGTRDMSYEVLFEKFGKYCKKHSLQVTDEIENLKAGIEKYKTWYKQEEKIKEINTSHFVPSHKNASTYLNNGCWLIEYKTNNNVKTPSW